jgi:hypothetical protein
MRRLRTLSLLTAVMLLAGCGSSSSPAPKPRETITGFAQRIKSLVTSGSCAEIVKFEHILLSTGFPACATEMTYFHKFTVQSSSSTRSRWARTIGRSA